MTWLITLSVVTLAAAAAALPESVDKQAARKLQATMVNEAGPGPYGLNYVVPNKKWNVTTICAGGGSPCLMATQGKCPRNSYCAMCAATASQVCSCSYGCAACPNGTAIPDNKYAQVYQTMGYQTVTMPVTGIASFLPNRN